MYEASHLQQKYFRRFQSKENKTNTKQSIEMEWALESHSLLFQKRWFKICIMPLFRKAHFLKLKNVNSHIVSMESLHALLKQAVNWLTTPRSVFLFVLQTELASK